MRDDVRVVETLEDLGLIEGVDDEALAEGEVDALQCEQLRAREKRYLLVGLASDEQNIPEVPLADFSNALKLLHSSLNKNINHVKSI